MAGDALTPDNCQSGWLRRLDDRIRAISSSFSIGAAIFILLATIWLMWHGAVRSLHSDPEASKIFVAAFDAAKKKAIRQAASEFEAIRGDLSQKLDRDFVDRASGFWVRWGRTLSWSWSWLRSWFASAKPDQEYYQAMSAIMTQMIGSEDELSKRLESAMTDALEAFGQELGNQIDQSMMSLSSERRELIRVSLREFSVAAPSLFSKALKVAEIAHDSDERQRFVLIRLIKKRYVSRADIADLGLQSICKTMAKGCQALVQNAYSRLRTMLARSAAKKVVTVWGGPIVTVLGVGLLLYDLDEFHAKGVETLAGQISSATKKELEEVTKRGLDSLGLALDEIREAQNPDHIFIPLFGAVIIGTVLAIVFMTWYRGPDQSRPRQGSRP